MVVVVSVMLQVVAVIVVKQIIVIVFVAVEAMVFRGCGRIH